MADCASLLDEELSSFVFNYLTENSDSQYGEEEVCSDRLDSDFPDIDLSQLDASDFDSVNCLSELHWCNDQAGSTPPASVHYSTADQLFEIEEENAALLAALTDSLDGMVDAAVGGLSVFPALGEGPDQEDEDDDDAHLPLNTEDFSPSLGAETKNPSLLEKLLLTPPNVPTGSDTHRDGGRHGNRGVHARTTRIQVKSEAGVKPKDRKPRAARPAGRLCTELHRHLTTGRTAGHAPHSEEDEDGEEDDDEDEEEGEEEEDESESEEEEEEEGEEEGEEEEESGSDGEGVAALPPAAPPEHQYSSEKELHSVVELIRYMHTYCLPMRKQHAWDRKEREPPAPVRSRAPRPEAPRAPAQNSHGRAAAGPPSAPGGGGAAGGGGGGPPAAPRRPAFSRRREPNADSLLRVLLECSTSFDVSKPYRLHSAPYAPAPPPPAPASCSSSSHQHTSSAASPHDRTCSSPSSPDRRWAGPEEAWLEAEEEEEERGSFSVRRSRRLASFPSRFAKRLRPGHRRRPWGEEQEERRARVKGGGGRAGGSRAEQPGEGPASLGSARKSCCHHEKQPCLCLPLHPKTSGEGQFSSKSFEQTLAVDLCGTAGLTPPTTPPHKPSEDELFKPTEGVAGSGGDPPTTSSSCSSSTSSSSSSSARGGSSSAWLPRSQQHRKLPEQTELYAQLRREGLDGEGGEGGEAGAAGGRRPYGDHDYCALSLGESRKRSAALLGAILRARDGAQREEEVEEEEMETETGEGRGGGASGKLREEQQAAALMAAASDRQSHVATPPASEEEEGERSSSSRSPSPAMDSSPGSPASKTDSSEVSVSCTADRQRNKAKPDEDNCQVFYIHNLPSTVTHNMLRKRFQVFGSAQDCKVIIRNEERCGVIKIRQGSSEKQRREGEVAFQSRANGLQRLSRKRYIDLDEAGPGPVKSKYDALDFDTLLKEAQKSLHR